MKYINAFVVLYLIVGCVAFLKGLFHKNEIVTLLGLVIIGHLGDAPHICSLRYEMLNGVFEKVRGQPTHMTKIATLQNV